MIATRTHGEGPAVLWIHGYTMDSSTWQPLWDRLPGWRHVGADLPGHGASDPMPRDITLPRLAAELTAVAKAESAERLIALSFGSCVALQVVIDEPELMSHVVLGAPTIAGAAVDPYAERRYKELAMLKRFAGPGELMADRWMQSPPDIFRGTEKHPTVRAALRKVIVKHPFTELNTGAMRSLTNHVHTDADLRRITAALLAIVGDEDMPAFIDNAARLHDVIDADVITVPGAGHLPLLERPDAVAAAIDDHLRRPI
ncbi:MAG TPA: alpha/beta hydrolase [Jatrophihabitantaceae bacterium]